MNNFCKNCKNKWWTHETYINIVTGFIGEEYDECQTWCEKYEQYLKEKNIKFSLFHKLGYKRRKII